MEALSMQLWGTCGFKDDSGCLPWDFCWHIRWGRVYQEIFAVLQSHAEYNFKWVSKGGWMEKAKGGGGGRNCCMVWMCVSLPAAFHMAAVRSVILTMHQNKKNMTFSSLPLMFVLLKLVGREPAPQVGQMQVDLWSVCLTFGHVVISTILALQFYWFY